MVMLGLCRYMIDWLVNDTQRVHARIMVLDLWGRIITGTKFLFFKCPATIEG